METQHFSLPWPPSLNTAYPSTKTGRRILSKKGRAYQKEVWALCAQQKIKMLRGTVSITIQAYPPDRRKRDLDNLFKMILDSLQKAFIIEEDSLVYHLAITKHAPMSPGRVEINLEKYELMV